MKAYEAISEGLLVLSAIVLSASLPHRTVIQAPSTAVPTAIAHPALVAVPDAPSEPRPTAHAAGAAAKADQHTRVIVVSLADRRLALVEDGQVRQVYTVAVGKDSTPSPTGTFTIVRRVANPTYYHAGKIVPPGPGNPVGDRWMGLSKAGYGIHGTNTPRSIGKAASHGCIRMATPDLEALFAQVRAGDRVEIIGERNEETASLFGEPAAPATSAAVTLAQGGAATPVQPVVAAATTTSVTAVAAAMPLGQ
ncbi:MAG TPA: L,D-transpeptidase [Acidobacteriaceae bacterium]|jgi:lipoprotein-anchoring transpeptidase ErfK/SrfK|nr:L,D-transpeptidase [Acidobacteriaceae bacterium]